MTSEEIEAWEERDKAGYIRARENEDLIVQSYYDEYPEGVLGFCWINTSSIRAINELPSMYDIEREVRSLPGRYGLDVSGKHIKEYIILQED